MDFKCPSCGSYQMAEGKMSGWSNMFHLEDSILSSAIVKAYLCLNCGLLVRRVDEEQLKNIKTSVHKEI